MLTVILKYFFYLFGAIQLLGVIFGVARGRIPESIQVFISGVLFLIAGYYFTSQERKSKEENEQFDKWNNG